MKSKGIRYIITILVLLLMTPIKINAETLTTGRVAATNNLKVRKGPSTSEMQIATAKYNSIVTILSYKDSGNGCNDKWAEIKLDDNKTGFVCSTFIEDIVVIDLDKQNTTSEESQKMKEMTDEEFDKYLTDQGFPNSYKIKLKELHKLHPTWIFKGVKSKYSWNNALNSQDSSGTSLLNVNPTYAQNGYEGYLSVEEADYNHNEDKFIPHDGTYWFQANRQTIAYYLDPRNFLDEKQIFMFEELFYYQSYQTIDVVKHTLSSEFLRQFAPFFMKAAEESKVSPVYLASLAKQEVGTSSNNICSNGKAGVLQDGVNYTGYYNFYNIGASSSSNPKLQSLKYAKSVGWDSQEKAIVNGSKIISNNYVNCGQYTSYFQKFNTAISATKPLWHQYTTNITALVSPAISTYNAYKTYGLIEKDFVFAIPIYDGLPDKTTLPNPGNPNNWLKELKVNGTLVTNFNSDTQEYTVNIPYQESVNIEATQINSKAKIDGIVKIELKNNNTTINIVVTAQNKSTRTYKINIIRQEKVEGNNEEITNNEKEEPTKIDNKEENNETNTVSISEILKSSGYNTNEKYLSKVTLGTNISTIITNLTKKYNTTSVNIKDKNNNAKTEGTIVTGDKITISNGKEDLSYEVVIFGDIDGNGTINVVDLLSVQKNILGYTKLTNSYLKAADVNKDNKINVVDLLMIQKHILNVTNISQG